MFVEEGRWFVDKRISIVLARKEVERGEGERERETSGAE